MANGRSRFREDLSEEDLALLERKFLQEKTLAKSDALRAEGMLGRAPVDTGGPGRRGNFADMLTRPLVNNYQRGQLEQATAAEAAAAQGMSEQATILEDAKAAEKRRFQLEDRQAGYDRGDMVDARNRERVVVDDMEDWSNRQVEDLRDRRRTVGDLAAANAREDAQTERERQDEQNQVETFAITNDGGDNRLAYKNYAGDWLFAGGDEADQKVNDGWYERGTGKGRGGSDGGMTDYQFDTKVERLADRRQKAQLPAVEQAWTTLDGALKELVPEGTAAEDVDLPGVGYGQNVKGLFGNALVKIGEATGYDAPGGKQFRSSAQGFINAVIRSVAGLNQTLSEEDRALLETGLEPTASDTDIYRAIQLAADKFDGISANAYAGSNEQVRDAYHSNLDSVREATATGRAERADRASGAYDKPGGGNRRGPPSSRKVKRTGTDRKTGEKIIEYEDGSVERR